MQVDLTKEAKEAVETYQCPGCVVGSDVGCGKFKQEADYGVGCRGHVAGTRATGGVGLFFLGMPTGFCRTGFEEHNIKIQVFRDIDHLKQLWKAHDFEETDGYGKFNVAVWKYKNLKGHIFVRGMHPRRNMTFLHVILDSKGYDEIQCQEITEKDVMEMN